MEEQSAAVNNISAIADAVVKAFFRTRYLLRKIPVEK